LLLINEFVGTTKVEVYPLERDGQTIWLIDTPGFDDTNISDADVLEDLAYWLSKSFQSGTLLSGMIYLHPISNNRMQGSAVKNLRIMKKLIGDKSLHCVVLGSTMWVNVEKRMGVEREEELIKTSHFWGEMVRRGSAVLRHAGSQSSALAIIDHIVRKRTKVVLDLQEQIVNQHRSVIETEAGKEVESALRKEREKFGRRMKETEEELKQALKNQDKEAADELLKVQDQYRDQIAASTRAIEDMRVSMQRLHDEKEEAFRKEIERMKAQRKRDEKKLQHREGELERLAEDIQAAKKNQQRQEQLMMEKLLKQKQAEYLQESQSYQATEHRRRQRSAARANIIAAGAGVGSLAVGALTLLPLVACSIM
jgi:hypothetical protein